MDQRLTEENMYMSNSGADNFSDDEESEVNTDRLTRDRTFDSLDSASPMSTDLSDINITQDNQYFETADIAQPDLTSSGDNVHSMALDPAEEERKKEELRAELKKIEDEINVLRPVLEGKVKRAQALKRELGITPLNQVKHDISEGVKHLKESTAYQKTNVVLRSATEKTSSALSTAGASVSRKLSDIRNSNKFRSFEERMGSAYSSVKRSKSMGMLRMRSTSHAMPSPSSKVVGSKSEDNFEDVLNSTAAANGGGQPQTEQPLPEEKVPL
ncbi:tumor protein D52-like isoform X22 [Lineus longissimus]|uniref:tumor protein D52-like isoform X22 n=1 Tax=Lineus longissimus TaxID=88925 RepID=UPI00315D8205